MQVELFGCTGAGKTTLIHSILQTCQEQEIDLLLSDDFLLKRIRLNGIRNSFARTLLLDIVSFLECQKTLRYNYKFYVFVIRTIIQLPISWFEKLNLTRNVLKRIGTFEIMRRCGNGQQVVLVDGGTLQAAHHLFVHVSVSSDDRDLSAFVKLVPLPEVAVYIKQSQSVLVERTTKRGHKRIKDSSQANIQIFVKRAVETFNTMVQQLVSQGRLSMVDNQRNIFATPGYQNSAAPNAAIDVICSGIDSILVNSPTGHHI